MPARLLLAALALLAPVQALAHTSLVASVPADGSRLAAPPPAIELRFDEPVRLLEARLLDAAGTAVPVAARAQGELVRIEPGAPLADGHYLLSYRVTSLDSHDVGGSIVFAVGAVGPAPDFSAVEAKGPRALRVAARALRDAAVLAAAGAALFLLGIGRFPGDTRLLLAATCIGILAAGASVALQGVPARSSFGTSAALAMIALAVIACAAVLRAPWPRRILLGAGAAAAVASFLLTGHAQSRLASAPLPAAHLLHVACAAFWVGSLAALFAAVANAEAGSVRLLRRFSPAGMAAVGTIALAGGAMAWHLLESPAQIADTQYGRLLACKAFLLVAMVGVASANRWWLLPRLEAGIAGAAARLRSSIALELFLAASVIAITAILVQTPPPAAHEAVVRSMTSGDHAARLTVTPGRAGLNAFRVELHRGGQPLEAAEVSIELANATRGIEPIVRALRRVAPGEYGHDGGELAVPGAWRVTVRARVGDFDSIAFEGAIEVMK